jgi:protein tyrosine/serine phosphatase
MLPPADAPLGVVLAGAMNFRDLGGYHTADGRRTRSGRVFRSNSLQELTPSDLEVLRDELRLATVMDLRSPKEIANDGLGPLEGECVRYVNLPMLHEETDSGAPGRISAGLVPRYLSYLEFARHNVVRALETIADERSVPLVFHCSAGKDRTGVLAALVLGCVGVEPETVVSDYAAKQHERDRIVAFLRRRPTYTDAVDEMHPDSLESEPATMREFLRLLDERHGGARGWALHAGADEATLRRLEENLLEPAAD